MATFKFTIPEETALWHAVGYLPPKARNAEIYRLATTALLQQSQGLVFQQSRSTEKNEREVISKTSETQKGEGFLKIDLSDDLLGMLPNN